MAAAQPEPVSGDLMTKRFIQTVAAMSAAAVAFTAVPAAA